ncbi:MAG: hypothetical protein NT001_06350 [Candidatus Woesearchaeota archaeon]|nr:hypothetical protein [Candidatus Woesearchaeota archaeon]
MDYLPQNERYGNSRPSYKKILPHYASLPDTTYGRYFPVTFIEPLMDSIPLSRDFMPYGVRGFWIIGDTKSYHSATDSDPHRVSVHENIHRGLSRSDPNHPEWIVRLIEDLRLGKENYN